MIDEVEGAAIATVISQTVVNWNIIGKGEIINIYDFNHHNALFTTSSNCILSFKKNWDYRYMDCDSNWLDRWFYYLDNNKSLCFIFKMFIDKA